MNIKDYTETVNAEPTSRVTEAHEADLQEWQGQGRIWSKNGYMLDVVSTYMLTANDVRLINETGDGGSADWDSALIRLESLDDNGEIVGTVWEK